MNYNLTRRQWAFLREMRHCGQSWFFDHPDARALTRRGLAKYQAGALRAYFVITEKGRNFHDARFGTTVTKESIAFDRETDRLEEHN